MANGTATERHWTIYADRTVFGDGVTTAEMMALARAERDAVLRRWPGAVVRIESGLPCKPTTDDQEIGEYVERTWERILSTGGNGGCVPEALAGWMRE